MGAQSFSPSELSGISRRHSDTWSWWLEASQMDIPCEVWGRLPSLVRKQLAAVRPNETLAIPSEFAYEFSHLVERSILFGWTLDDVFQLIGWLFASKADCWDPARRRQTEMGSVLDPSGISGEFTCCLPSYHRASLLSARKRQEWSWFVLITCINYPSEPSHFGFCRSYCTFLRHSCLIAFPHRLCLTRLPSRREQSKSLMWV